MYDKDGRMRQVQSVMWDHQPEVSLCVKVGTLNHLQKTLQQCFVLKLQWTKGILSSAKIWKSNHLLEDTQALTKKGDPKRIL